MSLKDSLKSINCSILMLEILVISLFLIKFGKTIINIFCKTQRYGKIKKNQKYFNFYPNLFNFNVEILFN